MKYKYYEIKSDININGFYTAFESYYTQDYKFDGEYHDFWEVMYIKKGSVSVTADDRIYKLCEGEMIFHKPNEFHKFTKRGKDALSYFVMSFSASGEGMKNFEKRVYTLTKEQQYAFLNIINYLREQQDIYKHEKSITYLPGNVSSDFLAVLKNMTELFLTHYMKNTEKSKQSLTTSEAMVFKNAVNIMYDNIYDNINSESIAKSCNVSLSYLKKIFSKHTGKGVHDYFLRVKINEATKLLKDGKTVAETAEMLSFSSQNYFSTVYKRITEISPNKIKK